MEYYDITKLKKKFPNCEIYMIYGEKSNGKTFSINLQVILENYFTTGKQGAYIRRWTEDIMGAAPASMYNSIWNKIKNDHPEYKGIIYYRKAWYLVKQDDKRESRPFCYAFSIGSVDHTNGSAFPDITSIFFDEFATRGQYQPDEIAKFQVLLSNIIRDRGDVTIYMAANTVNKFCPYFQQIGFKPDSLKQGDSVCLKIGKTRYAIEYAKSTEGGKPSDKYFAPSKTVSMITKGAWEMADYPKAPASWTKKDIKFSIFIIFNGSYIQGDYIALKDGGFLFFYPKKEKSIKNPTRDIVFSDEPDYRGNWYSCITRPTDELTKFIALQFEKGKVFYADDDTGEILRNYIIYSIEKTGISRL